MYVLGSTVNSFVPAGNYKLMPSIDNLSFSVVNINTNEQLIGTMLCTQYMKADGSNYADLAEILLAVGAFFSNATTVLNYAIDPSGFTHNLSQNVIDPQVLANEVDLLRNETMLSDEVNLVAVKTKSTKDITLSGVISALDEVVIDTETYVIVDALTVPAVPFEVLKGATDEETFTNLFYVINNESAIVQAVITSPVITIESLASGSAVNYGVSTTSAGLTIAGATMTGGTTKFTLSNPNAVLTLDEDAELILPVLAHARRNRCKILQDAIGGHALTITSTLPILYVGGVLYTPTQTAGALDKITLYTDGSDWECENTIKDLKIAGA